MSDAFFGLPSEVIFCKRCVISNQRPSSTVEFKHSKDEKKSTIGFDNDGVCDACHYQETKVSNINWEERENSLKELCEKHKKNDGSYDIVIPGSGGKDSAFTSHILKYKYGMNPLTVTWAPHKYTEIGWKNFENWIHEGGLDNILLTPNGRLHRYLTKQAFVNLLHPFQPFIVGQRIIGPSLAAKFGVELVMYGENQAEYGNNVDDNYIPTMDRKFFSISDPLDIVLGGKKIRDIIEETDFTLNDFAPYIPPSADYLESKNVEVHYLGYYLKWHPQSNYYYSVENGNFEAAPERTQGTYSKYNSIDDKIDDFHYLTTRTKFGIGRATYDAAQEIRSGDITREEGVMLVNKFDHEFPDRFEDEIYKYLSINQKEFPSSFDLFEEPTMTKEYFSLLSDNARSPHIWKYENNKWVLRSIIK